MATSGLNVGIFISDLLESTKVADTDLLLMEDRENTKNITFRNLRISLINDYDQASETRIYSSKKVQELVEATNEDIYNNIHDLQFNVSELKKNSATKSDLSNLVTEIDDLVASKVDLDRVWEELANTRKLGELISGKDLAYGNEDDKIHLKHLGEDIIDAMTGATPITPPSIPKGGWRGDDIANNSINSLKLTRDFLYRGDYTVTSINGSGSMNRDIINTGLYEVASDTAGLPHYGDDYDETRLVEVWRYGVNAQYIVQRVYYKTYTNEVRPYFERKGLFANLTNLEFTAHFEFSDRNKVESTLLADHFANRGVISSGDIFRLTADGNYLCESGCINLPTNDRYLLNIRSFGDRREFEAKKADIFGAVTYSCYEYRDSVGVLQRTEWYNVENTEKSKFDGKTLLVYGDGIAYGIGITDPTYRYDALLHSKYGYIIQSRALMEATCGNYEVTEFKEKSILKQIDGTPGLDTSNDLYAIIFAGSEDYISGKAPMGQTGSMNDTTFKGSLNLAIKKLLERQPKVKIMLVTPIYRASIIAEDGQNGDDTIIDSKTLREFAGAMVDIGKYNHIPVLDLYSEGMINKYNYRYYMNPNGIYLNREGQTLLAEKIHDGMCRFY